MKVIEHSITETGNEMNFIADKFSVRKTTGCFNTFEIMKKVSGGWEIMEMSDKKYDEFYRQYWNYQLENEPEILVLNAEKTRFVRKGN